ncbi:type III secretion system outer membrane ring subunit SctC [Stenotrophomonas sp.]|uniref:type III secretion system outer membrane ring subunit SctC n=1 Tax=Stenotrophomonas sp. TaxID=69392 RepID=UPI002FC79CBE
MSPRFLLLLLLPLSLCTAAAQTPLEGTALTSREDLPHATGFVARGDGVEHLLNAVGARSRQAVVISANARKKRLTGSFDLARPLQVLSTVSAELGLVWYSDGQSIYVYEAGEQKNAVGRLRSTSLATLVDFLRKARLADARYPVRGGGGDGTFYVAGPPVYVDIVLNAASYLDELYEGADASPHHVEVIRLEHSFVNGRRYGLRSQEAELPGMAEVLAGVLQMGNFDAVVKQAPPPALSPEGLTEALPEPRQPRPMPALAAKREVGAGHAVILPYAETNSLIVRGTLTQIEQVKRLVGELDTPRRQIELSLWIIDIKKTELDRLGVNWSGGLRVGSHLSIGLNQEQGVSTLDGTRFLASVQALSSKGDAHIVSRPVVLTQENVPAYFDSNQTFYAQLVGERSVALEQVTYGTLVSVRPRISSNEEVEMQLKIEDGAADSTRSIEELPMVNRTAIDTIARVPHAMSLLVGGYTRQARDGGSAGVPGLRRIPVLGRLFRQDSASGESIARVFLIQPRVVVDRDLLSPQRLPERYGPEVGSPLWQAVQALIPATTAEDARHGDADSR